MKCEHVTKTQKGLFCETEKQSYIKLILKFSRVFLINAKYEVLFEPNNIIGY